MLKPWIKDLVGAVVFGLVVFLAGFIVVAAFRGWL